MKKLLTITLFLLMLSSTGLAQDKNFGAGIIFGNPTGLSIKNWMGKTTALQGALAWNFEGKGNLSLTGDYLWHNYSLITVSKGRLPVYYGVGGDAVFSNDFVFGVRGVVGLDYMISGAPVDIFAEIVPTFYLIPSTSFKFHFGLGVRYFF